MRAVLKGVSVILKPKKCSKSKLWLVTFDKNSV